MDQEDKHIFILEGKDMWDMRERITSKETPFWEEVLVAWNRKSFEHILPRSSPTAVPMQQASSSGEHLVLCAGCSSALSSRNSQSCSIPLLGPGGSLEMAGGPKPVQNPCKIPEDKGLNLYVSSNNIQMDGLGWIQPSILVMKDKNF